MKLKIPRRDTGIKFDEHDIEKGDLVLTRTVAQQNLGYSDTKHFRLGIAMRIVEPGKRFREDGYHRFKKFDRPNYSDILIVSKPLKLSPTLYIGNRVLYNFEEWRDPELETDDLAGFRLTPNLEVVVGKSDIVKHLKNFPNFESHALEIRKWRKPY